MKPQFFRKVLKNGMTVLLEKRDLPIVSVAIATKYGGIHESANERGIAHFIEHMLYKGTKKRTAKQIAEEIEKNGGELNGFTSETMTAFWCKMPSKHLDIALHVLSDMAKNPLFDSRETEKERKVIFEEMKIYHDTPAHYVFEKIQEMLYDGMLKIPLIGTHETMNSIDSKKLLIKFKESYQPNNLVLCVVGEADFSKILKFAEKNFGNEKGLLKRQEIILKNETKIETRKGIDQANMVLAFHSPLSTDKKVYAAEVLMAMMGEGMSSRLFQEIRAKRNLAYSIHGALNSCKFFSYSNVYVGCLKENVEKVKKLILDEFEKVSKELTEKELNQVKEQLIGNYYISMEDSALHMHKLISSEVDDDVEEFYKYEKNINTVKLENVKKLAKIKEYSFFALVPE
ncbi:MAG: pitrilysin family protein [Nanoarchaeota archaeon]